jgi:uncharacterized protein YciI
MHFVIRCLDRADAGPSRTAAIGAHQAYLATRPIEVVLSGPLTSDDGARTLGSLFIVEAANRIVVERFTARDPLFQSGVWASIEIHAFLKRVDNRAPADYP